MTLSPEDQAKAQQVVAEVLKANEEFYQAIETADMDLMRAIWIGSAEGDSATCIHPGQPAIHGLSQVLRSWAVVCARINYLQFFITDTRVRLMENVAIVTCVENVLAELPDRPTELGFGSSHYETVNVFVRDPLGNWRLATHSSAPVFPSSAQAPAEAE